MILSVICHCVIEEFLHSVRRLTKYWEKEDFVIDQLRVIQWNNVLLRESRFLANIHSDCVSQ